MLIYVISYTFRCIRGKGWSALLSKELFLARLTFADISTAKPTMHRTFGSILFFFGEVVLVLVGMDLPAEFRQPKNGHVGEAVE